MFKSDCPHETLICYDYYPVAPPITAAGIAIYTGLLSAGVYEILVTGTLPKGETRENVTYFIVDRETKTIVSQVVLPDASSQFSGVEMRLKVARLSSAYDIGTFSANGEFKPIVFLSVRDDLKPSPLEGARGE